jgi:hypothetical protein
VFVEGDLRTKQVQIAHISRDPGDSTYVEGAKLDVVLHVRYESDPFWLWRDKSRHDPLPLFTTTLTLNLQWAGNARLFVPTAESAASLNESSEILNEDQRGFLRRNADRLIELATMGSDLQRQWLRDFAGSLSDVPESQRILAALDR